MVFFAVLWSLLSIALIQAAGEVDASFNPGGNNIVHGFALQADRQVVVVGSFTSIGGVARNRLARLGDRGSVDNSFVPSPNNHVYGIIVRPDGKLLVSGIYNAVSGQPRGGIALLNANGTLDAGFGPQANQSVEGMGVQPDGKIVIGGFFTQVGGVTRNYIARLNADGSLDSAFNPDANAVVRCVVAMPDGKILIAGSFTTLGGQSCSRIARLNSDGTMDSTFVGFSNGVAYAMALLPDGKILAGGTFTSMAGVARAFLARLNADGSLDTTYPNPLLNGLVNSLALQTDGRLLIGGQFTSVLGTVRNRLARMNADGSLDLSFDPNMNSNVHGLMLQQDGRILAGGGFTGIGAETRNSLARLTNDVAGESIAVVDTDTVRWLRTGASPEVTWTEFDVSVDGGTQWTALGKGSRISGGWEWTGPGLPDGGYVRGRGVVIGGYYMASSYRVEATQTYHLSMQVEQPVGVALENISSRVDFGSVAPGAPAIRTFTLKNKGAVPLSNLTFSLTGEQASEYEVIDGTPISLPAGESTTFAVKFTGSVTGMSQAGLRLSSSAPADAFDLTLTGRVLSFEEDGDDDGLNDASEMQMAALGFDWQVAQPELVGTLYANAAKAGLYTETQVQNLNVGSRLIMRDPVTKDFAFSVSMKRSTDLITFEDLLISSPMATFTPDGRVEFRFTVPGPTQFFRLEAR